MVHQQTCQPDQGWSHNLYLLGCCTVGPLLGLTFLIGMWIHPAFLALFTITFFALSGLSEFWLIEPVKYILLAILVLSLIIRFAGKKVFD